MTVSSCKNCPSFLSSDAVSDALGVSYGHNVAVCSARGIPLGHVRSTDEHREMLYEDMAKNCPIVGKPAPRPLRQMAGTVGSVSVFVNPVDREKIPAVSNCASCTYIVPASEVLQEFGWQVAMCAAKGALIPKRRLSQECKGCTMGRPRWSGEPAEASVSTFSPFPIYGDAKIKDFRQQPVLISRPDYDDPRTCPTQHPVSSEDAAQGIRAWMVHRHPKMPDKKAPLYVPIFDPDFFPEEERELIPQAGGQYRPELYRDYAGITYRALVAMLGLERTPVLIGPAGTGKTEFFAHLGWRTQSPFSRISITRETELADIMGYTEVVSVDGNSVTNWVDGVLPRRYTSPGVLVIDEPNTGPDALWQGIRPLMDNASQLVIPGNRNKIYKRDPWCLLGLAMNPAWDARYIGTNEMNEADGQRTGAIWVDYPPEEEERAIIVSKLDAEGFEITNGQLDTIMKIAKEIRDLCDPMNGGTLTISLGLRVQVDAALYWRYLSLPEAYMMAMGDRLDPDQRQQVLSIVNNYMDEANE